MKRKNQCKVYEGLEVLCKNKYPNVKLVAPPMKKYRNDLVK